MWSLVWSGGCGDRASMSCLFTQANQLPQQSYWAGEASRAAPGNGKSASPDARFDLLFANESIYHVEIVVLKLDYFH